MMKPSKRKLYVQELSDSMLHTLSSFGNLSLTEKKAY